MPPGVCIYCGASESLTKQHVLPDWLYRELRVPSQGMIERIRSDGTRTEWHERPFSQSTRTSVMSDRRCSPAGRSTPR
jgi:hypothetical protein